ncbi:MAG: DUF3631 domain-containing protein [Alphaproteobacteria bacterium]|nr:DUF3631 domain-containing protein [Alphaproteobacteria bacterium]
MTDDTPKGGNGDDVPESYEELPPADNVVSLVSTGANKRAEEEIARLAELSKFRYEQVRGDEAERLGVRKSVLDDEVKRARSLGGTVREITYPESKPYPEPVDGDDLLSDIAQTIRKYVVLPQLHADAIALWALMTWVHDGLEVAPFLNVRSAVKRSGKSTLVDVLGSLVYRPLISAASIRPAPLFRIIERDMPSMLLDETDNCFRDDPELSAIIKGSQRKSAARVIRCEGEGNEPVQYSTWAPKAIVGIGGLPDTVTDRCIIIELERKFAREKVTLWRRRDATAHEVLRSRITRWSDDYRDAVIKALPEVSFPAGLDDRQQDSWEPLLAIAGVAGGDWPDRAELACSSLCADNIDKESTKELLLADLSKLFEDRGNPEALETADILTHLHGREDRPWSEWSKQGKPMSARALASQLKGFKIYSGTVHVEGLNKASGQKGYKRESFVNTWSRYLTPDSSVQTSKPAENKDISPILSVQEKEARTDKKPPKPAPSNGSDGWTDRTPPSGQEHAVDDDIAEERAAIIDVDGGGEGET